jgi:hydroxymethyl cephem carbamoyltransferase
VVSRILAPASAWDLEKSDFRSSSLWSCGLDSHDLRDAARLLADRIFDKFLRVARTAVPPGLPLIISGGCGLNCDWNSAWAESDHFASVFVPPCPNDSGSAIGTAVDVQSALGLGTRISWSVYSGPSFVVDIAPGSGWTQRSADASEVAGRLARGMIIPFVEGRSEIGPRALGHRSLRASALDPDMTQRLNVLKGRESYRPIAPCCRDADFDTYFHGRRDPYMLFFDRVVTGLTPATTHVDGSARVQVVSPDNIALDSLLAAFGDLTGVGVLCNTSLNYPGRGFINRMSELLSFCDTRGLDAFVVDGTLWNRS